MTRFIRMLALTFGFAGLFVFGRWLISNDLRPESWIAIAVAAPLFGFLFDRSLTAIAKRRNKT